MPPHMHHRTTVVAKYLSLLTVLFFCALMLATALQYFSISMKNGLLQIKPAFQATSHPIALCVYICSNMLAMVAVFVQFSKKLRTRHTTMHRWIGRTYVFNVLLVAAPAGLIMSFNTDGNFNFRTALTVQSCLWWYFTYTAYWSVIHRDFVGHRHFMVRSFALTLSIITLRLWAVDVTAYFEQPPINLDPITPWLGFIPNALIAEWWIRRAAASHTPVDEPVK